MFIHNKLSNGNWGKVLSIQDINRNIIINIPQGKEVKIKPPAFDAGIIEIEHPDKEWQKIGSKIIIKLGIKHPNDIVVFDDNILYNPEWNNIKDSISPEIIQDVLQPEMEILKNIKDSKLLELENWWKTKEEEGLEINDIVFGISPDDIALLNGIFTIANTSVSLGVKSQDDKFFITDKFGKSYNLSLSEMTTIMLLYSEQRSILSSQYANFLAVINSDNIEEITNLKIL